MVNIFKVFLKNRVFWIIFSLEMFDFFPENIEIRFY